jgi:hypothetical protein
VSSRAAQAGVSGVVEMGANPTYLLAFGFMISTSVLFVLWHLRHLWLRRRGEQELLSLDVGNVQQLQRGAPSFIIARLPVFKYNSKVMHGCDHVVITHALFVGTAQT